MERKIQQYLEGNLPKEEQSELLKWIKIENNQQVFDSVKAEWWKAKSENEDSKLVDLSQLRLGDRIKEKQTLAKSAGIIRFYKYAAIILLAISLGGSIFTISQFTKNTEPIYTEIHTDYGQVSGLTLPDGTEVWVNAGTKLKYNNQYGLKNRDIQVQGEAFFSVSKNKKLPFVVDLGALKVEVTGTRFEVSNYVDSKTMDVVLEEGSVDIHSSNNKLLTQMMPEEMVRFDKTEMTIEKIKVKSENYTSWKDGALHIFELPLEQLVLKLEKRYNQKFKVEPTIKNIPLTFSIEGESLSEILHLMEKISPVKAIQKEDIIEINMNH